MKLAALILVLAASRVLAQDSSSVTSNLPQSFNESGKTSVQGRTVSYLIRRLPVDSFPDLPDAIRAVLIERGCMIPQTYEAHRPENVIHASFERPGSSDWAVLCSQHSKVDLLVFFARTPEKPMTLVSVSELGRLERHDLSGVFGFDWGIDRASPEQVRQAQAGMERHPPLLDHDALAETVLNQKTVFHFYKNSVWTIFDVPE